MDERQKEIITSAMAKVLVTVYIVILIVGITKLAVSGSVVNCMFEIIFIFAVPVLVYLFTRKPGPARFPMSIAGIAVKPEATQRAFKGRIMGYIFDSLQYSAVIALFTFVMDIWNAHADGSLPKYGMNEWLDTAGGMLVQFMGFFAVYFALDFIIYEYKAKRYCTQEKRKAKRKKDYKKKMETEDEK